MKRKPEVFFLHTPHQKEIEKKKEHHENLTPAEELEYLDYLSGMDDNYIEKMEKEFGNKFQ